MSIPFYSVDPQNPLVIMGRKGSLFECIHRSIGNGVTIAFSETDKSTAQNQADSLNFILGSLTGRPEPFKKGVVKHNLKLISQTAPHYGVTRCVSQVIISVKGAHVSVKVTGPFAMAIAAAIVYRQLNANGLELLDADACLMQIVFPQEFREKLAIYYNSGDCMNPGYYQRLIGYRHPFLLKCMDYDNLRCFLSGLSLPYANWQFFIGAYVGDVLLRDMPSGDDALDISLMAIRIALMERMRQCAFQDTAHVSKSIIGCLQLIDPIAISGAMSQDTTYHGAVKHGETMVEFSAIKRKCSDEIRGILNSDKDEPESPIDKEFTVPIMRNTDQQLKFTYDSTCSSTLSLPRKKPKTTYVHFYKGEYVSR